MKYKVTYEIVKEYPEGERMRETSETHTAIIEGCDEWDAQLSAERRIGFNINIITTEEA